MNPVEITPPVPADTSQKFSDPAHRQKLRDELRAEEWAMHRELMAAARVVLKNFYENPHKSTVADLARIIDLASKLGRLATERDGESQPAVDTTLVMIEFKAALQRVYSRRKVEGRPLPEGAAVVDVHAAVPLNSADSVNSV